MYWTCIKETCECTRQKGILLEKMRKLILGIERNAREQTSKCEDASNQKRRAFEKHIASYFREERMK